MGRRLDHRTPLDTTRLPSRFLDCYRRPPPQVPAGTLRSGEPGTRAARTPRSAGTGPRHGEASVPLPEQCRQNASLNHDLDPSSYPSRSRPEKIVPDTTIPCAWWNFLSDFRCSPSSFASTASALKCVHRCRPYSKNRELVPYGEGRDTPADSWRRNGRRAGTPGIYYRSRGRWPSSASVHATRGSPQGLDGPWSEQHRTGYPRLRLPKVIHVVRARSMGRHSIRWISPQWAPFSGPGRSAGRSSATWTAL